MWSSSLKNTRQLCVGCSFWEKCTSRLDDVHLVTKIQIQILNTQKYRYKIQVCDLVSWSCVWIAVFLRSVRAGGRASCYQNTNIDTDTHKYKNISVWSSFLKLCVGCSFLEKCQLRMKCILFATTWRTLDSTIPTKIPLKHLKYHQSTQHIMGLHIHSFIFHRSDCVWLCLNEP